MRYLFLILAMFAASPAQSKECVVLLHGLARSSFSMAVLEWRLGSDGYQVVNIDYPSRSMHIDELAVEAVPSGIIKCEGTSKVHFVTHSLGGILLRQFFSVYGSDIPLQIGRTVMLGPPNSGTEVVDETMGWPGFELLNGIAGTALSTSSESIPNQLGPVKFEVGVIAGNQSISPYFSSLITGDDDGKVSVESTKVEGMADHIVLPVTHTFMMNDPAVFDQILAFLQSGKFDRTLLDDPQ